MFTALYGTSVALSEHLRKALESAPGLGFGGPGARVVSLNSPFEMRREMRREGLSVWLYRLERDAVRLNSPVERLDAERVLRPPLPLRAHYLMTPVTSAGGGSPDVEQKVMGRVLQALHTRPILRGADLIGTDFEGLDIELHVHLETQSADELARIWESLEGSFQLCVSYEVSIVNVDADASPERISPVRAALPEYGVITGP